MGKGSATPTKPLVEICKCATHGWYMIAISEPDGGSGKRIIGSKCCGSWDTTVKSWRLNKEELLAISEDFKTYAELAKE